jgi:transposase-like protein
MGKAMSEQSMEVTSEAGRAIQSSEAGDLTGDGRMDEGAVSEMRKPRIYSAGTIAAARQLVESTVLSMHDIARRMEISPSTLSAWRKKGNWTRPDGAPEAPTFGLIDPGEPLKAAERKRRMLDRLYRVFSRQLSDIEARLREEGAMAEERDARMLGTLARTLGTLMALERGDGAEANQTEPIDPHAIRAKLAQRIRELEGGEEEEGGGDA